MAKTIFPAFLTAEISAETQRNLQRFESLHQTTFNRIANTANQVGARTQRAQFTPSTAGVAASRAAAEAQAMAMRASQNLGRAAEQSRRPLERQNRSLYQTSEAARSATKALKTTATGLQVVQGPLGPLAGRLTATANAFRTLTAAAFAAATVSGFTFAGGAIASDYATVRSQLRPLFEEQVALNTALGDVARIAKGAKQGLQPVADLYARLTSVGREFNLEQRRVAGLTETIAKAARLSGGSRQAQEAGLTQLSQGLGSGILQGDELRSVRENTRRLAQAIAEGLGVSVGELKELGSQSVLTTEVIVSALERSAAKIEKESGRISATLPSAFQSAQTSAAVFAGRIDQALGATERLANVIIALSDNLDVVAAVLGGAAIARGAVAFGRLVEGMSAAKAVGDGLVAGNARLTASVAATAAAEADATGASLIGLRARQAELARLILVQERARASAAAQAAEAAALARAGIAVGPAIVGGTRQTRDEATKSLIRSRRELAAVNAQAAAAEAALASSVSRAVTAKNAAAAAAAAQARRFSLLGTAAAAVGTGFRSIIGLLGGPWGAALTVAAGAVFFLATRMSDLESATEGARQALDNYGRLIDQTTGRVRALSDEERRLEETRARTRLRTASDELGPQLRGLGAGLRSVANPFVLDTASRVKFQQDRAQIVGLAKDIEAGGRRAVAAYRELQKASQSGNLAAAEFLKSSSEDFTAAFKNIEAASTSQRALLALSGKEFIDPRVAERNAQAQAEFAASAEVAAQSVERQNKALNTLNDNDQLQKNYREIVRDLAGGVDLIERMETTERRIALLKAKQAPAGQGAARADAIKQAEAELDIDRQRLSLIDARARGLARERTDAQNAQRDFNRGLADARKETRELETAEAKRKKTLEQIADIQDRIANITGRAADTPLADGVLRNIRQLRDLQGTELPNGSTFTFDVAAAEKAVFEGMKRDVGAIVADRERELEIDRLILAGRDREAAALAAKMDFQRSYGTALAYEEEAVRAITEGREKDAEVLREIARLLPQLEGRSIGAAVQGIDFARAREDAERLVSIYEAVPRSLQQGFESVWENVTNRGIKSAKDLLNVFTSTFRRLQGQLIGEALFGGLDRQIGLNARGAVAAGASGAAPATDPLAMLLSPFAAIAGSLGIGRSKSDPKLGDVARNTGQSVKAQADTTTAVVQSGRNVEAGVRDVARAVRSSEGDVAVVLGDAVQKAATVVNQQAGQAPLSAVDVFNKVGKDLGGRLDKLFKTGGKGGKAGIFESAGSELGAALGAYSAADTITSLLGIGGVAGSAIKGAATGFALGGLPGAGIGALVGGLTSALKKTARSSATVSTSGGQFQDATVTGTSASRKQAASSLGDAFENAIESIVNQLDAEIGDVSLSIGTRKKKFTLDPTGRGRTKGSGVQKFDTEEAAIEAALRLALSKGVAKGISAASQRILQSGQDLEKAVEKAALIESVPKRLRQLTDPVGFAVDEINKHFEKLIDALLEGGATAEQIADAEKLYGLERKNAIEAAQQAQSDAIDRFLNSITAGSASPLSKQDTFANAKAALEGFRTDINAGKAVDDDKLVEALQTFYDAARDLKGSRGAFFTDFEDIKDLAERARSINRAGAASPTDPASLPASPFEAGERAARLDAYLAQQNSIGTTTNAILQGLPTAIAEALRRVMGADTTSVFSPRDALTFLPFNFGLR